jgi:hypothetical protein
MAEGFMSRETRERGARWINRVLGDASAQATAGSIIAQARSRPRFHQQIT